MPFGLRYPLAYDRALCADVCGAFVRALTRSLKWRAKRLLGLGSVEDALVGALTVIERSDGAVRVNPHFHTLALDGVNVRDAHGRLAFHPLPAPTADEVAQVAAWTHARIERVLERHGRSLEGADDAPDAWASEQPVLASCYAASASDVQLLGGAPGHKTDKLAQPLRLVPSPTEPLAEVGGVHVHALEAIDGRDRKRLERLCRYLARPPLSQQRLELHTDGRVRIRLKAPWKDGTHSALLDPLDFIARLAALVPPPRFHMLRYHGVLAAHCAARPDVVPGRAPPRPQPQLSLFEPSEAGLLQPPPSAAPTERPPPARHPWAWLLRRVFAAEVTVCPAPGCGGRMRIVEIATEPSDIARVLTGRPGRARAPPPPPPSAGQLCLAFG